MMNEHMDKGLAEPLVPSATATVKVKSRCLKPTQSAKKQRASGLKLIDFGSLLLPKKSKYDRQKSLHPPAMPVTFLS